MLAVGLRCLCVFSLGCYCGSTWFCGLDVCFLCCDLWYWCLLACCFAWLLCVFVVCVFCGCLLLVLRCFDVYCLLLLILRCGYLF